MGEGDGCIRSLPIHLISPTGPGQSQTPLADSTDSSQDDKAEFRKSLLALGFAAVAMVIYALSIGLIQVSVKREEEVDQPTEEEDPDVSAFLFPNSQHDTED